MNGNGKRFIIEVNKGIYLNFTDNPNNATSFVMKGDREAKNMLENVVVR